jgi:import inner membrane translocase subunit TIM16
MSGFFARVVAQAVIAGAGILTKAFVQAYARAQAGGGAAGAAGAVRSAVAGSRMPLDMARGVLNLEKGAYDAAAVQTQFERYFAANDPDSGGSFYVQSKVNGAREALLEELKEGKDAATAGGGEGGGGTSSKERPMK